MHCRMFSGISGLYPLDANTKSSAVTPKTSPDITTSPLGGQVSLVKVQRP